MAQLLRPLEGPQALVTRQVARLAQGALDAVPEGLVAATPAPVKKAGVAVSDAAAKFASRFLD